MVARIDEPVLSPCRRSFVTIARGLPVRIAEIRQTALTGKDA
jgi:hypothetical protein